MIVRSANPQVIEFPFSELAELITPTEKFYVRDHFPQPQIERDSWRLRVEGCVENVLELSYDDLLAMPSRTMTATLECAGNGRSFLVPPAHGVQWELGGIGTAEWIGVPLKEVLARAVPMAAACDVIMEGADSGEVGTEYGAAPKGAIHFTRSVPLEKALSDEVLLVYRMNGEDLTVAHGFPLRALVGGWYAVASVKWLSRIIVSNEKYTGYFQSTDYSFWQQTAAGPVRIPITSLSLKSQIARPKPNQRLSINQDYEIFGACWSGQSPVARVEVSTDAGSTWHQAELLQSASRTKWTLWRYRWRTPSTTGATTLMSRATDSDGGVQPASHHPDHGDYMINHTFSITVEITAE